MVVPCGKCEVGISCHDLIVAQPCLLVECIPFTFWVRWKPLKLPVRPSFRAKFQCTMSHPTYPDKEMSHGAIVSSPATFRVFVTAKASALYIYVHIYIHVHEFVYWCLADYAVL